MHDIGFLPISDIFQIILADADIFAFCLETTPSLSCAEIISNIFYILFRFWQERIC